MDEDEITYRRMTIHYRVFPGAILFTRMTTLIGAVFNSLGCRIMHSKDEPIEESDIPKR